MQLGIGKWMSREKEASDSLWDKNILKSTLLQLIYKLQKGYQWLFGLLV